MSKTRCSRCQQLCDPIDVHGSVRCSICGSVIDECCQGETVSKPSERREGRGNDDGV